MIADQYPGLLTRSDDEKLQLAGELLADVMDNTVEGDPALVSLLESRLTDYQLHPERVSTWSEVKAGLLELRQ